MDWAAVLGVAKFRAALMWVLKGRTETAHLQGKSSANALTKCSRGIVGKLVTALRTTTREVDSLKVNCGQFARFNESKHQRGAPKAVPVVVVRVMKTRVDGVQGLCHFVVELRDVANDRKRQYSGQCHRGAGSTAILGLAESDHRPW